jgi:hypothetical protein
MSSTKGTPKRGRSVSELGGHSPTRPTSATKDRIKSAIGGDDNKLKPIGQQSPAASPSSAKKSGIPPLRTSASNIPKIGTSSPQNNNQKSLKISGSIPNENAGGLAPIQENPNLMTMASPRSVIMDLLGASIGSVNEKYEKRLQEKEEELFNLTLEKRKADQEVALYKERRMYIIHPVYILPINFTLLKSNFKSQDPIVDVKFSFLFVY